VNDFWTSAATFARKSSTHSAAFASCVRLLDQIPVLTSVNPHSLPVKFPKQRLQSTELTIGALEDKASSVRRYAIALLTKLILTHPYGLMHGGLLRIEEWEDRYKTVSAELEQVETKEMERPAVEKDDGGEGEGSDEDDDDDDDDEGGHSDDTETVTGSPSNATPKATPARTPRVRSVPATLDYPCMYSLRGYRSRARSKSVMTPGVSESGDEMSVDGGGLDTMEDDMDDEVPEFDDSEMADPETPARESVRSSRSRSSSVTTAKTVRTPARRSAVPKTHSTAKSSVKKEKKAKKENKGRKSDALDLSALTNEQAALAALESNHILHLKLRKRYYAEGLNFIRQIEGAMEILGQLLGSKNKPEVLEAMEFFRVAHEYQFANAEVQSFCFIKAISKRSCRLASRKCFTSYGQKTITPPMKTATS
jgi:condensin complex subunit 1